MKKHLSKKEKTKLIKRDKFEKELKSGDRIKAVFLNDDGFSYHHIARVLFIDEKTVSRHIKDYQEKHKLKNISGGSASKLDRQKSEELIAYLEKHTRRQTTGQKKLLQQHFSAK